MERRSETFPSPASQKPQSLEEEKGGSEEEEEDFEEEEEGDSSGEADSSRLRSKVFRRLPTPGIWIWISLPRRMGRAPREVPREMRSPGMSVCTWEILATVWSGEKIMSLTG